MEYVPKELYQEIYLSGKYDDPHTELANRLGCSRNEAKRSVFIYLYSSPVNLC